ncbi:MAG: DUF2442 domain-containing protein [Sulfurimonas sp.]|uniref:DUF2442 domain-containing protein n=1 Tax=Sulfurimonas sp. TaxID=2022749 RepID=UPI00260A9F05|nr:DUF2442 domain-containing protein [Sulfurimonas sp.]MDD5373795.1 DUF2442 domain-containing protein [Sulfurimonas sp.]
MSKTINIIKAEYLKEYQIHLEFSDGMVQIIDFKNFILSSHNPAISKYKDLALFKAFSITEGDLEWNDYDLCFPIIDLYENKNIESFGGDNSNRAA